MQNFIIHIEIAILAGLVLYGLSKQGKLPDFMRDIFSRIKEHISTIIRLLPASFGFLMFLRYASCINFSGNDMFLIFAQMFGSLLIGIIGFGAGLLVLWATQCALNNWQDS